MRALPTTAPGQLATRARRILGRARVGLMDLQQRRFERRLGVSTSGLVHPEEDLSSERVFYEGSQWRPVHRALAALRPGPSDVLVDLGSGKGQVLLVAARLPFGRVVGVERDPELHRTAVANLTRARSRLRCRDVRPVCADAVDHELPDDTSVVFLYCPFLGDVFRAAMERVLESYDRRPRALHLVYDYPWEHDWLLSTGRVQVVDVRPSQSPALPWWWRTDEVIVTYRVVGGRDDQVPPLPRALRPPQALARWSRPNGQQFVLHRTGHAPRVSDAAPPGT